MQHGVIFMATISFEQPRVVHSFDALQVLHCAKANGGSKKQLYEPPANITPATTLVLPTVVFRTGAEPACLFV